MDTIEASNNYLKTLYLKSKSNIENGYNEKIIAKLVGLDKKQSQSVKKYLEDKNYVDTENIFGDRIKLTTAGIDKVSYMRDNKVFKVIKFKKEIDQQNSRFVILFIFYYDVIDENGKTESNTIKISINRGLSHYWGFNFWDEEKIEDLPKLAKVLLQIAKDKIIEKIKEGTLPSDEEIILLDSNTSKTVPYNHDSLIDPQEAEYEIEIVEKVLNDVIEENKLAASIIESRDIINAIFHSKKSEKLLLLNEERNLLDLFKSAKTMEEFSHRISSLGEFSRNMNIKLLRELTKESDTKIGSVELLKNLLNSLGNQDIDITEILKNIGRIRKGYPVHTDKAEVIKGYKYFGLEYPVENYETTWTTLLKYYLTSLKKQIIIFKDNFLNNE